MASANELVIKINGDVKNYTDALDTAKAETEDLENALKDISKISAVAFAALTAEILVAAKAFSESQAATNKLSQALQNQGIYSKDLAKEYSDLAKVIQEKTGIDDDSIVAAQATIQGLIGQQKVSEGLTQAIVDLAAAKGMDLNSTAELIGKGIGGHVQALQRLGLTIDEHLDKEQRTAKIIELVSQKFGGQAEAANKGLGAIKGLASAFGDFQEEIGGRFSPLIEAAIKNMTSFFQGMSNNAPLMDLITSLLFAGTVVTGLGTAIGVAGTAFLAFRSALAAAGVATNAMTIATRALVGATGIGLLAVIAAEIYLNWSTVFPRMQAIYQAFVGSVSQLSGGLSSILSGVFTFDVGKVKAGMEAIKTAIQTGYQDAIKDLKPITDSLTTQDPKKLQLAQEQANKEVEIETLKQEALQSEREVALAKISDVSAQEIAIKQQELETLKALQSENNKEIRAELEDHWNQLIDAEAVANQISVDQNKFFTDQILADNQAYLQLDAQSKAVFQTQNADKLRQSLETEKSVKLKYANDQLAADIKRRNDFLIDEQKFGTAYATIHAAMNSTVYQGTKSAFGNLAELSQSENSRLKSIGKAAALANVAIKTAEGALNIYAGFSTIPIVGVPLGIAAAAAYVAYGVEQASKITSAADGGIITGGTPGVDSVPAMLMPGELVVPTRNFDETVNAVAAQRAGDGGVTDSGGGGGVAEIVLTLRDNLIDLIEAKLVERQRLNISIVGA